MKNITISAKLFIGAIAAVGVTALAGGLLRWECKDPVRFLSFLIIAMVASRLKIKLPGTIGNMSVNLPFTATHYVGWQTPLLVLPVMAGAYVSYRRYFRLSAAMAIANLQFATLPAGARAKAEIQHV